MKKQQVLSDDAEKAIVNDFNHHMESIANSIGGPDYFLFQEIVKAVERGVTEGVRLAAKGAMEKHGGGV